MFKKLLIGTLAAVIVVAGGASAYSALAAPGPENQPVTAAGDVPAGLVADLVDHIIVAV